MSKPVKYRILLLKDDIIILKRMTVDKVNPGPKQPSRIDKIEKSIDSLRKIVIDGFKMVSSRLDKVEDILIRNNLR